MLLLLLLSLLLLLLLLLLAFGSGWTALFCIDPIYILLLSMLLISRTMYLWKINFISSFINFRFRLFRPSVSSFSSQYHLFLYSSRSFVPLLPTPFTSVICPSMACLFRHSLICSNEANPLVLLLQAFAHKLHWR